MDIIFRVDASLEIGTGHVMRCLTLADALRNRGAACRFVCREHSGNLSDLISQRGYEVHVLPLLGAQKSTRQVGQHLSAPYAGWLGADWETDARQTMAARRSGTADWLVVDHYGIDVSWERFLRPWCRHVMVIDDLVDRSHDCDLLLNQNPGRNSMDYSALVPEACRILLGPQYALLRPEFAALRPYSLARRVKPELRHLLITMGGVDKGNATGAVLDALLACPVPENCRVTVVMGRHAPWRSHVMMKVAVLPWTAKVEVDVSDMAKLMADSDLAIGAAGSTSLERCCLGLPSLVLVLEENQRNLAGSLQLAGAAVVTSVPTLPQDFKRFIQSTSTSNAELAKASTSAANVTRGTGAPIVSEVLLTSGLG